MEMARPTVDDLRKSEIWRGRYRDVRFEIVKWGRSNDERWTWNFYLYVHECQVPADKWHLFSLESQTSARYPGRLFHYPDRHPCVFADIDFNGGATFYEKREGYSGHYVKVGCDYNHTWTLEFPLAPESVLFDCLDAIDQLWELCPYLKTDEEIYAEREQVRKAGEVSP